TLVAAVFLTTTPTALAQPAPDAKATLADAAKAAKERNWAAAVKLYEAANNAQPSASATEGAANAHYQLGQHGEAFAAYTEWKEKYAAKAPAATKKLVDARLKELEGKTGLLTIAVDQPGAAITVDGKEVGK